MPKTFDQAIVAALRDAKEVRIRTSRHKGRGVVIWIVVIEGSPYVRSVRGTAGKWFTAASDEGHALLVAGDRELPVHAVPVTEQTVIEAVSTAFLTKYATSPYAQSIVRPDTLSTTLRLDPR